MRYIVHKDALNFINVSTKLATDELSKPVVITDDPLHFKHIPFISVVLTADQVEVLKSKGLDPKPEETKGELFAADYEKTRSMYYRKAVPKGLTGAGTKIAIMDTGCIVAYCPVDFAVNFADESEGVAGPNASHGQMVTSIIKSEIGLASGAEVHFLKVISDDNEYFESAFLAGVDYCIEEGIDIINMSFSYASTAFDASIASFISGGGVVVAAPGNATSDTAMASPAKLPDVVSINAINENGEAVTKNIINEGGHGITAACSGIDCEVVFTNGVTGTTSGTSFSAPFFVGLFACYKQELGISDNYEILNYILTRCLKKKPLQYFGNGIPTF